MMRGAWLVAGLLSLACLPAHAEWVFVTRQDHGGMNDRKLYINPKAIDRIKADKDGYTTVHVLINFAKQAPPPYSYRSWLAEWQIYCDEEKYLVWSHMWYAKKMGRGAVLHSGRTYFPLDPIKRGSEAEAVANLVCE